jgi:hypothetical protein
MPSADFCRVIVAPYGLISPYGQLSRSPGVNTYLSTRERRVYAFGLRWIEDFALCCRLVPPKPPQLGSCSSPRVFAVPCRSRAASFPGTIAGYPVAIPLYPSPPSGWVWDLLSSLIQGKLSAPLRIRAVPGTQPFAAPDSGQKAALTGEQFVGFHAASSLSFITLRYML